MQISAVLYEAFFYVGVTNDPVTYASKDKKLEDKNVGEYFLSGASVYRNWHAYALGK
jgi:hypothetical protein